MVRSATHLVRSELVNQVMHVDEENTKITNLLVPLEEGREKISFFRQSVLFYTNNIFRCPENDDINFNGLSKYTGVH